MKTLKDLTEKKSGLVIYPETGIAIWHEWNGMEGLPRIFKDKDHVVMSSEEFKRVSSGVVYDAKRYVLKYAISLIMTSNEYNNLRGQADVYKIKTKKGEEVFVLCPF